MPSRREHLRLSRKFLGAKGDMQSMGEWFQRILDNHSGELGPRHRAIDHTWERLNYLSNLYGPIGYAETLIHLGADYGLFDYESEIK